MAMGAKKFFHWKLRNLNLELNSGRREDNAGQNPNTNPLLPKGVGMELTNSPAENLFSMVGKQVGKVTRQNFRFSGSHTKILGTLNFRM